jgi:hypothetical protein
VSTKSTAFCVMTPCRLERALRAERTYRLHIQGREPDLTVCVCRFLVCLSL